MLFSVPFTLYEECVMFTNGCLIVSGCVSCGVAYSAEGLVWNCIC
jgi:hypothetical protein